MSAPGRDKIMKFIKWFLFGLAVIFSFCVFDPDNRVIGIVSMAWIIFTLAVTVRDYEKNK